MNFSEIVRQAREQLSILQASGTTHLGPPSPHPPGSVPEETGGVPEDQALKDLREKIGDCRRCKLHAGRTHLVFGTGSPKARLAFVGEAPGADEDLQGKPFVGKAGQLLTRMIEAMGMKREEVYIANIIKCRPPGNRNPEEDEIATCEPFLLEQLRIIRPRVVCALGKFAAQTLLKTSVNISALRGTLCDLDCSFPSPGVNSGEKDRAPLNIKVVPTFHPAYLLRNPSAKKVVWEDLKVIMRELNVPLPAR
jgi:DNA polymerase